MCYTFPRIAACDYHRYGSGGAQENINAICILALNIINDKVGFLIIRWVNFINMPFMCLNALALNFYFTNHF